MSLEPRRCDVKRCNRLHNAHGLCLMHYRRQQRKRMGAGFTETSIFS